MIVMNGPPMHGKAAENFARFVLSVDKFAVVTVEDNGRVIIKSDRQPDVMDALYHIPRSLLFYGGQKGRKYRVLVLGRTDMSGHKKRGPKHLQKD